MLKNNKASARKSFVTELLLERFLLMHVYYTQFRNLQKNYHNELSLYETN